MVSEVLREVNANPSQLLIWVAFGAFCIIGNWAFRELSSWIARRTQKKLDEFVETKENEKKSLQTLYRINREQLHDELQMIIDDCKKKGYRTVADTDKFGRKISNYFDIQGNHDGNILEHDFEKITTLPTMELPIPEGFGNVLRENKYSQVYNLLKQKVNRYKVEPKVKVKEEVWNKLSQE